MFNVQCRIHVQMYHFATENFLQVVSCYITCYTCYIYIIKCSSSYCNINSSYLQCIIVDRKFEFLISGCSTNNFRIPIVPGFLQYHNP